VGRDKRRLAKKGLSMIAAREKRDDKFRKKNRGEEMRPTVVSSEIPGSSGGKKTKKKGVELELERNKKGGFPQAGRKELP